MAFLITCLYGAVLFGAGLWFVRQGKKKQENRRRSATWDGLERRAGRERRQDAVLTR